MNDYDRKLTAALAELADTGIWRSNSLPPIFHLFQKLGLKPRPPHYAKFSRTAINYAIWFGVACGLLIWPILWKSQGMTLLIAVVSSCLAGAWFGILMALYCARGRKKHGLSDWGDL